MKSKTPLWAALLAMLPVYGNAFTLDAVSYDGADLPSAPASIRITGYGEVIFEASEDKPVMVDSGYRHDTLPPDPEVDFDPAHAVRVHLRSRSKVAPNLVYAGLPAADKHPAHHHFSVKGSEADMEKPYGIPEAASAMLGLLGAILLLRRSR